MQQDRIYELIRQRAKISHPFKNPDTKSVVELDGEPVVVNPEQLLKGVYNEARGRARILTGVFEASVRAWSGNFGSIDRSDYDSVFRSPMRSDYDAVVNPNQPRVQNLVRVGEQRTDLLATAVHTAVKDVLVQEFLVQAEEARTEENAAKFTTVMDVMTGVMLVELSTRLRGVASTSGREEVTHAAAQELAILNPALAKYNNRLAQAKQIQSLVYGLALIGERDNSQPFIVDDSTRVMRAAINSEDSYNSDPSFTADLSLEHYHQTMDIDSQKDAAVDRKTLNIMKNWLRANMQPKDYKGSGRFFVPPEADSYALRVGAEVFADRSDSLIAWVTDRIQTRKFKDDPDFILGRTRPF